MTLSAIRSSWFTAMERTFKAGHACTQCAWVTRGFFILLLCSYFPGSAAAQTYPSHALDLIVTSSAGGSTDVFARPIADKVSKLLGYPVVVLNLPGANTIIGADRAARAAPDGHTLLIASASTLVLNPATRKDLPYDADKDFAPVVLLATSAYILVVRADLGVASLPELIELAKKHPGQIKYGMSAGSPSHFAGLMLAASAGIDLLAIPYKDTAQAAKDIARGEVDFGFLPLTAAEPFIEQAKVKVVAVASHERFKQFPTTPTVAELGFKGFWAGSWYGIVTKAGSPEYAINKLNADFNRVLKDPELKARLETLGYDINGGTPDDFKRHIAREREVLGPLAKQAHLQIN